MPRGITGEDDRYLVFLSLVERVAEYEGFRAMVAYEVPATTRELAMLETGDAIQEGQLYWRVIEASENDARFTLVAEDLLSPMKADYVFRTGVDGKKEMIDWGVEVLLAGLPGNATAVLAGADFDNPYEVRQMFIEALAEQSIPIPNREACLKWKEADTCVRYLAGEIPATSVLQDLTALYWENDYDDRFVRWYMMSNSLHYGDPYGPNYAEFEELTADSLDEVLRREAKRVLTPGDEPPGITT